MRTELLKTKGRARWTRQTEWTSQTLTIARDATARLTGANGGWGGAWDQRQYRAPEPTLLTTAEAIATLESWGVDAPTLARVPAFQAALPADTED